MFDSGVGGLTVLKALRERLPNESTVYLGDTARVPYGTKSAEVVTRYSLKNAEFLLRHQVKLVVVACNTASAVAVPSLSAQLGIPVIGVIEPGALAAVRASSHGRIGVIGTPGTIQSRAYHRALEAARPGVTVVGKACPLFVPLVEEGWLEGDVPRQVAHAYLGGFKDSGIDTLVLGCTHYPLLRQVIASEVGADVVLVDSAEATAEAVSACLRQQELSAPEGSPAEHRYFVTDVPDRFVALAGRFLGRDIDQAEQVDISM